MARLVLALHAAPAAPAPAQNRSLLAFKYAQAALVSGHQIDMIFFYADAVLHASTSTQTELINNWLQLSQQHNIPLVICNTVAEQRYSMTTDTLVPPFQNGGLTEFAMAAAAADRVVQL
ncbi:DsrE family protein [Pseudidiomarina woesei]|uniref:Sulfur relay (Sulfurtransferase) complex TusBCD TusD component, DsrE family n=1 Tax=Pseudidiomarina woesei TaxID=1381080 RepID=A0A0K6GW25_9GAMM|nr:DsrE family protein [Pseudidiomarina woesei]CUA82708.1 Sulfur relay (sulfurtransferase) complex TusBCD TusD component, DsrE family [Pseudidiomarina woesei]